jgi:hypothetical protein
MIKEITFGELVTRGVTRFLANARKDRVFGGEGGWKEMAIRKLILNLSIFISESPFLSTPITP